MVPRRPRIPLPDPGALRSGIRWLNSSGSLSAAVRAARELLPGDKHFGDPLSTAGTEPAQVLARRAWAASGGRWTVLAELGLAALQVADWLGPSGRGLGDGSKVAVLFTDLVGYSDWAVRAGDEESLEVLRRVDARVTDAVTEAGGAVVKRIGDGTMAVFPDATPALEAARKALEVAPEAKVDGYDPTLRAGLHFGSPQPIGSDFIGVDVNIAARLCQAAGPNEILMTETIATLAGDRVPVEPRDPGRLPGVPRGMRLYGLCDGPG